MTIHATEPKQTTPRPRPEPPSAKPVSPSAPSAPSVPPLEPGDRLTRAEFLRRWEAMPRVKNPELIGGQVYKAAALTVGHGSPHTQLITAPGVYVAHTPGVQAIDNASVLLDEDNVPQPDVALRILPECGGQTKTTDDDYVQGAPELIAEIAATSASYDMHDKLDVYRRCGVREYIVWQVREGALDWFVLRDGRYESLDPGDDGIVRSGVMPGLWLAGKALLDGEMKRVLDVVQQGVAAEEHAAFVERLEAARQK